MPEDVDRLWRRAAYLILAAFILATIVYLGLHYGRRRAVILSGAVLKQDPDTRRQSPIAGAEISAADKMAEGETKSDFAGFFKLTLNRSVRRGQPITLHFRHSDYQPLDVTEIVGDPLTIVRMVPLHPDYETASSAQETLLSNVFIRYSTENTAPVNIGTGVKTFQVQNIGNVPCSHRPPCSPDGKWKAAIGSASLDAGGGNVFGNARLSCISGPCPFTKVETDGFSHGGHTIQVSVRDWSDTTTFLLQAEVFHSEASDMIRDTYPVIFGRSLNFTLPAAAEGPTIEAEMNGTNMVFPLGPNPVLSWADCNVRVEKDEAKIYRCELRPGYRFQ